METARTELAPGATLEVTTREDRALIVVMEVMEIDKRTVTVKVGDTTRTLTKGSILTVNVDPALA
jgi:uncharacterized protein YjdB